MAYDVVLNHPGGVLIPRVPPRSTDLLVTGPLPWADVRAYGADPTGVADSTTAFQAALAVAQGGTQPGTLYIPAGDYLLSGAGTELLLITKAVTIRGDGMRSSTLKIAASVGAGVDVIRFYPPDSNEAFGLALRDFGIVAVSGNPARHAINLDITETAAETRFVARATLERLWLGNAGTEFGGRAIEFTDNDLAGATLFTSEIRDCQIYGGIRLVGGGDSVAIDNCVISGANVGIEADLVSGAALLNISRNNITALGGGVWIKGAAHPIVAHNWFETSAALVGGSGNGALVDLDGKAGAFPAMPEIYGNQVSILTGVTADGIRLNRCTAARVRDNTFTLTEAGSFGIKATTTATDVNDLARDNRKTAGSGSLVSYAGAGLAHPPVNVYEDVDDFTGALATTGNIGKLGWSFGSGTITLLDTEADHPGIVRQASSAIPTTCAVMYLRATTGAVFLPAAFFDVEFVARVNQVDADTTVRYGVAAGVVSNPPANGIYFERLGADTNWFAVTRAASSETRADMGVAITTGWVTLRIRRVSSTQIGFSINGGTEVLATLTIPTASMNPVRQIITAAAADKTHDLDRFSIRINGLAR